MVGYHGGAPHLTTPLHTTPASCPLSSWLWWGEGGYNEGGNNGKACKKGKACKGTHVAVVAAAALLQW